MYEDVEKLLLNSLNNGDGNVNHMSSGAVQRGIGENKTDNLSMSRALDVRNFRGSGSDAAPEIYGDGVGICEYDPRDAKIIWFFKKIALSYSIYHLICSTIDDDKLSEVFFISGAASHDENKAKLMRCYIIQVETCMDYSRACLSSRNGEERNR